jgi:hypothetical protein
LQPPEPVTAVPSAPPASTDSNAALAAQLDDVMDQAAIAANAQRDEEAGTPPPQTARQEATAADDASTDEDDDEADEDDSDAEAAPADQAQEVTPPDPTTPSEPPKYSRRDAARFAAELEQRTKDLADAQAIVARAQGELNAHRAADQHVLTQLAEISGYTVEANGRFKVDNLRAKNDRGLATDAERQEIAEMLQWAELAGPIYRAAEVQVTKAFSTDWNALKDLEGIGDAGLAKLSQAPNGVAGAREMHALAYQAGRKAAKAESDAVVARLRAENKSLKTRAVASAPQPAVLNGHAVPSGGGSFRDRAFKPDGSLNEDFDREVRAGKWLGVDLANQ